MNTQEKKELAAVLYYADVMKYQVPPFSSRWPEITEDDGYDIQTVLIGLCEERGFVSRGKKVGGISYLPQVSGGFGPHYGELWEHKIHPSGDTISCGSLLGPGLEAEAAVELGCDLTEGIISPKLAQKAIRLVFPAWEIVESRIIRKKKTLPDSLADNAAYGGCVLGEPVEAGQLNGKVIEVCIRKNGEVLPCSCGSITLEQMAESLAWLANSLIARGRGLKAGELVITGALTKPLFALEPGDVYSAEFTELGEAKITGGE